MVKLVNPWHIFAAILIAQSFHGILAQSSENDTFPDTSNSENARKGKIFSLFSIVQFKNNPCVSAQGSLNGTCYTASECTNKGGMSGGNCAAGFGVCCIFRMNKAGGTISQNNTYVQNPGFPTAYTSTSGLTYSITKVDPDVCTLRLDFNTFVLVGPQTVTGSIPIIETTPSCPDSFTVITTSGVSVPKICGLNTGQHIYVDAGSGAGFSEVATLTFSFNNSISNFNRLWDIKVSQIPCTSVTNPPTGCLQYYYSLTGRLTTFNFFDPNFGHLDSQQYTICIRPELGYCCINYQVCPDQVRAFSLSAGGAVMTSVIESCNTIDYIQISGATSSCTNRGANFYSRFCGAAFSTDSTGTDNVPICDCSPPFQVGIFTNALSDTQMAAAATAMPNTAISRGLCLDYYQMPC